MEILIPLTAIVISIATLVLTTISLRHKANDDYVKSIDERLKECEQLKEKFGLALKEFQHENDRLRAENIDLIRSNK